MNTRGIYGLSRRTTKKQCGRIHAPYRVVFFVSLAFLVAACESTIGSNGSSSQTSNPAQVYLAAGVGSLASEVDALSTYTLDNTLDTFVVTAYAPSGITLSTAAGSTISTGATILESGTISTLSNGVVQLGATYFPGAVLSSASQPSQTASWAVEIPGQAALVEVEATNANGTSTTFAPLVSTQNCPSLQSPQPFQFVTIPKTASNGGWNPKTETAFGSVSVSTSDSSVQFSNINQYTLPATNGGTPGTPANPAPVMAETVCSATLFGQTMSIPETVTVENPGGNPQSSSPSATVGISSSGFLLEDSGSTQGSSNASSLTYENVLGAGYGAIGLPKPSSALSTSTVASAQYQGILYGAASGSSASNGSPGFRLIGSFGYSNLATSCPTLPAPNTSTIIYGGEFANNDPSTNAYGNCDLAIDLGAQDSNNNGLYPTATVYVSAGFPQNGLGSAYSFPAVAVAGQISGKNAIFLIGMDTIGLPSQPWGIYLLQSN
ncbi:MAG: hypothetical protein ACLPY1_02140 [Terracidiphilus sp.]